MTLKVCPAAVVNAPREKVWGLLDDPGGYGKIWSDAHLADVVPPGHLTPGQTLTFVGRILGWSWTISARVEEVDSGTRVQMHVSLPFGIVQRTQIQCAALPDGTTRVQYG